MDLSVFSGADFDDPIVCEQFLVYGHRPGVPEPALKLFRVLVEEKGVTPRAALVAILEHQIEIGENG